MNFSLEESWNCFFGSHRRSAWLYPRLSRFTKVLASNSSHILVPIASDRPNLFICLMMYCCFSNGSVMLCSPDFNMIPYRLLNSAQFNNFLCFISGTLAFSAMNEHTSRAATTGSFMFFMNCSSCSGPCFWACPRIAS